MDANLTIVIPAYNEAENLELFVPGLLEFCSRNNAKLIIVNDGSKDSTKEVMEKFNSDKNLTFLSHKLNKGYGAAIKTGICACKTQYCITIDADGQHRIDDIPRMLECIAGRDADMVVGSRKGLKVYSYYRNFGKSIIRVLARILMTVPIHDINSGMKIYRTDLAKKYLYLAPDGMSFSDTMSLIFINNRHLVLEIPIQINERLKGESTIGIQTAFQTVMEIINIVVLFNPMKIFFPVSVLTILLTILWGLPLVIEGRGVSTGTLLGIISGLIFFLLGLIAEQLSLIRRNQK
jgi:glycosyltransferase involved in cell wall biosynthesis